MLTKAKLLAGAILVGAVATLLVLQHQAQVRLRDENNLLRVQLEQLSQLATENDRLSNVLRQASSSQTLSAGQLQELLRLRGEVGRLRQDSREAEKLRLENNHLRNAAVPQPSSLPENTTAAASDQLVPAEMFKFINTDLQQVLLIYGELTGAQLDLEERIKTLPVSIRFTNTEAATRSEVIRLLDQTLLEQAGIVVTHTETNRVMMQLRR